MQDHDTQDHHADEPIVPVGEGDGSAHPTVTDVEPTANQRSQTSDTVSTAVVESKGGMQMPRLGLGTWQLDDDVAAEMVAAAIEMGYRHIDTAQMYGNERGVGTGIARAGVPADELFVTTKVDNANHEPDALAESVEQSLERLGVDRVDLLLIHWPVEWDRISATMAALANVHAGGLTRHIGVSNFTIEQLEKVATMAPIEALQVECHPFFQQDELRAWCVDHGWAFTAYSPVAQGDVFDDETLSGIADAHGVTASAVALAWLIQLDSVAAIPRTSSVDHLRDNFSALDLRLSDDEIASIDALPARDRLVDPGFAPW